MSLTDEEYPGRISQIVESTLIGMTISVGCRVGLVQKLIDLAGEPKTSVEIAESLNLRERYVREWLKAVFVQKIIESDSTGTKFFLPKGRGEMLLTPWNSVLLNFYPSLAGVFPDIVDCFKLDGPTGLPYSRYPTFAETFQALTAKVYKQKFVSGFLPGIPGNVCAKLEAGAKVLEIACGNGAASLSMAQSYPKSTFVAIDLTAELIDIAKSDCQKSGLTNLTFHLMDATKLESDWTEQFDFIVVIDGIHDMAYPRRVLGEIRRVLRPGGIFAMFEVGFHTNPVSNREQRGASDMYALSLFHCMPVSLFYPDGEGLGNNWGMEMAEEYLKEAGFSQVQIFPTVKGFEESGQFLGYCQK